MNPVRKSCRPLRVLAMSLVVLGLTYLPLAYGADKPKAAEPGGKYEVGFEFSEGNKKLVLQWDTQPSVDTDRAAMEKQWSFYNSEKDALYRKHGFKPLADGSNVKGYDVGKNEPTSRQLCGGLALAPLAGGPFVFPTGQVWEVMTTFGKEVSSPEKWDIVVWRNAKGDVTHYALVEEVSSLGNHTIISKNGSEKIYRGGIRDFNSNLNVDGSLAVQLFGAGVKHSYYRLPWDRLKVKRLGDSHLDDQKSRPPLKSGSLRVQVVAANSNELLSGATVVVTFPGKNEGLRTGYTNRDGEVVFDSLPGGAGKYEAHALLSNYYRKIVPFELLFEKSATVVAALDPMEWVRTGPFFASNNQEGRKPKFMEVTGNSLSFSKKMDNKDYHNTMKWSVPPATLKCGQQLKLTINSSNEQGWANVGGWWNINCQRDGIGDASAGSTKGYRGTGSPDPHSAIYTFKFAPGKDPYIQISGGHDPAPDTWVLVTYKYVQKQEKR